MNEDERIEIIEIMWVGRGDLREKEWEEEM